MSEIKYRREIIIVFFNKKINRLSNTSRIRTFIPCFYLNLNIVNHPVVRLSTYEINNTIKLTNSLNKCILNYNYTALEVLKLTFGFIVQQSKKEMICNFKKCMFSSH